MDLGLPVMHKQLILNHYTQQNFKIKCQVSKQCKASMDVYSELHPFQFFYFVLLSSLSEKYCYCK